MDIVQIARAVCQREALGLRVVGVDRQRDVPVGQEFEHRR